MFYVFNLKLQIFVSKKIKQLIFCVVLSYCASLTMTEKEDFGFHANKIIVFSFVLTRFWLDFERGGEDCKLQYP
jgi:hypothetical protein